MPYNNLRLLQPQAEIESTRILKKTITASRALSEVKGATTNLPNRTLFIDTINLQEAQASSTMENIITTQDELFKTSIAVMTYLIQKIKKLNRKKSLDNILLEYLMT